MPLAGCWLWLFVHAALRVVEIQTVLVLRSRKYILTAELEGRKLCGCDIFEIVLRILIKMRNATKLFFLLFAMAGTTL